MKHKTGRPLKIYVDASPLAETKVTGIPHFTGELLRALEHHPDNGKKFKIILVIAFDKKSKLSKLRYENVIIKSIPIPTRLLNLIWKYNLLPPMDLLLGTGSYLFPNYKNWPLHKSYSLTYIHDLGFIRYPQFTQPKNLEFLKAHIREWISRTDLILTGSDHARAEIVKLLDVNPDKIARIYHGVDTDYYYPRNETDIKETKEKYGIQGDYILHIGSLEPRKNLIRLINAYKQLPSDLLNKYKLFLIGSGGWLNDEIVSAIRDAKEKRFNIIQPSKYVSDEDLPSLISGAALLVHPALYEGFGLSPLQAMACGVPVVVADSSSLPEVVGGAGILINPESESNISANIERVLTDENYRRSKIKEGLKRSKKFRWETSANELLNCIEQLNS